jgi:hypothetical protein
MKIKTCPNCGSTDLGDRWANGRKLMQYCHEEECNWIGEPRTPEKRRITDTKHLRIDDFYGWDFIIYDKYGHESVTSQTFNTEKEAMKELERDLAHGEKNEDGGPYTGVLFKTPLSVVLKGKMFKIKNGKCTKTN